MTVNQALSIDKTKEIGVEEAERIALMRELHLMSPNEKKAAMKKLGLGSDGNQWVKEAQRLGIIRPGQKFWAMHSESNEG